MKKNDITEIDLDEAKILASFLSVAEETGNRFLELGIEYGAYETSITAKIPTRLFIDKLRDNEARSSSPQDGR